MDMAGMGRVVGPRGDPIGDLHLRLDLVDPEEEEQRSFSITSVLANLTDETSSLFYYFFSIFIAAKIQFKITT